MSQQKQVKQLPTHNNGQPQQLSHIVPIQTQPPCPQNIEGVKYLSGEVLVGQAPNVRPPQVQEGQQPQSSIVNDHQSGPRPSTSSTISSDHFSSDYFSSNNSHECKHNDQIHHLPPGSINKAAGFLPPQEAAMLSQQQQQRGEMCLPNTNQPLITGHKSSAQIMQPVISNGKNAIHYIPANIPQYQHHQAQNCDQGAQYECQQRAAAKLCEHLSQNYDSGDHSGENSNISEYTEDDEEYEEEGYVEDGCERRMITVQPSSQNQSILKSTVHSDEHGYYGHNQQSSFATERKNMVTGTEEENPLLQTSKHPSCNTQKVSKTQQRACQTYYEDQATQTEDEEEDDEICHKHGCRYRRYQDPGQEDSTGLTGLGNCAFYNSV